MNDPEWREVEAAALSGKARTGEPIRVINLARLRPLWDKLVLRLSGTSPASGWVVRGPDGRYLWDDPLLGVRVATCTGPLQAIVFETAQEAEEAARRTFKSNFRKGMVISL